MIKVYEKISGMLFFNILIRFGLECYLEFSLSSILNIYAIYHKSSDDSISSDTTRLLVADSNQSSSNLVTLTLYIIIFLI
jgi:hypothetical protein